MTIKEAFEKLSASMKRGMKNPFFIMRNLSEDFDNIAANIEGGGGGSVVEVDPLVDEGIPIADITVDGNTERLYTPYITTTDLYSDVEHKVGVWYHDSISEDVFEKTITLRKNSVNQYEMFNNRTFVNSLPSNFGYIQITGLYALRDGWVDNMGVGTSTIISIDLEHNGIYVETNLTYTDIIATYRYTKVAE